MAQNYDNCLVFLLLFMAQTKIPVLTKHFILCLLMFFVFGFEL